MPIAKARGHTILWLCSGIMPSNIIQVSSLWSLETEEKIRYKPRRDINIRFINYTLKILKTRPMQAAPDLRGPGPPGAGKTGEDTEWVSS